MPRSAPSFAARASLGEAEEAAPSYLESSQNGGTFASIDSEPFFLFFAANSRKGLPFLARLLQ